MLHGLAAFLLLKTHPDEGSDTFSETT